MKLAVNGGVPVRNKSFTSWPVITHDDEEALIRVLKSGNWGRHLGEEVLKFEDSFAKLQGADRCVAIANGTIALEIALRACNVGAGDEVIVPSSTFFSTASSVLSVGALPVFVDIDPDTYCIDASLIEDAITDATKVIMPVHIGGGVSSMDEIKRIADKHNLLIIEDACQAHLAEWNNKKVGTIGDLGCFSFQASKNINSGEGGAIVGNNEKLMDKCYSLHTCGRIKGGVWYYHPFLGTNARLTEFQGALLSSQIKNAEEQLNKRTESASYLKKKLEQIKGIKPLGMYPQVTRHSYHLFILRYDANSFEGLSRDTFIKALQKEGIPCQAGYNPLHKEGFIKDAFNSTTFQRAYDKTRLDLYFNRINCPNTERACSSESIWIPQNVLLGPLQDMDDVYNALLKVSENYRELL